MTTTVSLRRLNDTGIAHCSDFLDSLTSETPLPYPSSLLTDPDATKEIFPVIEIEQRTFGSRFAAAEYLINLFRDSALTDVERDRGLWAWLSLFHFEERCSAEPSAPEYAAPMIFKRLRIGLEAGGEAKRAPRDVQQEFFLKRALVSVGDAWGENSAKIFVERQQPPVEGAVVEDIEANAVARIGATGGIYAPGNDVAGVEKFGDCQTGQGASVFVGGEYGGAKEGLHAARLDDGFLFRRAFGQLQLTAALVGRMRRRSFPRLLEEPEFRNVLVRIFSHDRRIGGFGVLGKGFGVARKGFPDLTVGVANVTQGSDTARLLLWIETGEVARLHRDRTGRSVDQPRQFDNLRVALMESSERRPAIEAEDYQ